MRERSSAIQPIRCAIYTRKSTEEGLEQDFNSLDAQREACAAYITSQRHEGWTPVPDYYDDGGYSGGNMDRPALKVLLADVALGKVDVIVVYKVDRLTRSLADFAKIVEILDGRGASFVSVTQSFNTTTSMGRLTLNVLLSFAQFEREVTGERIRDKIAASKAKGMWMGGIVPLGYKIEDRKLVIEPAEADAVRTLFERYLVLGSGVALIQELEERGIRSKLRVNRHGRRYGGHAFSRGALYAILQNRLYVGEVVHKGAHYAGQHEAIIDTDLFDRVQRQLANTRIERRCRTTAQEPSLLASLLYDGHGRHMSPSHANKAGRRYRYYRSQTESAAVAETCWRIGAPDIEGLGATMLARSVREAIDERVADGNLSSDAVRALTARVGEIERILGKQGPGARRLVLELVDRIDLGERSVTMTIRVACAALELAGFPSRTASSPIKSVRHGKGYRLIIPAQSEERGPNPPLVKLIAHAFTARRQIEAGNSLDQVAQDFRYSIQYAADLLRISYLSPRLIGSILEGTQPSSLTRRDLISAPRQPLCWTEQEQLFLRA